MGKTLGINDITNEKKTKWNNFTVNFRHGKTLYEESFTGKKESK